MRSRSAFGLTNRHAGRAKLVLGDLNGAADDYRSAAGEARTFRNRHSMYLQAAALATRIHGEAGRERIDAAFGILPPSRS